MIRLGGIVSRSPRRGIAYVAGAVSILIVGAAVYRFWRRPIDFKIREPRLAWSVDAGGHQQLAMPGRTLVGFLGLYQDELFAYLMFDFVRSRKALTGRDVMLIVDDKGTSPAYRIATLCPSNLLNCIDDMYELRESGIGNAPSWVFVTPATIQHFREETQVFVQAYSGPVGETFGKASPKKRALYLSRFLRFKSATDRRVLEGTESSPAALTHEEALALAADIIAVADFYDLPLAYFLGIGAMENNYLDVKGDLRRRVWKRRADSGDVIVRRGRRGVLVENPALGVWQITRETLRFAHSLFLQDTRDYDKLPPRLRPSRKLEIDNISPDILTTYAGLLLRYLLDYFHGDVKRAVGAYNGGPANPNEEYERGVGRVAEYARRVLDRAALLHETAMEKLRPKR